MSKNALKEAMIDYINNYFSENIQDKKAMKIADDTLIDDYINEEIPKQGQAIETIIEKLETDIFPNALQSRHPKHFAFIPGPASDEAVFGDLIIGAHNIHASNWINSTGVYAIEKNLINWAAHHIGYDSQQHGGLFVSGGSMANLTALIAARDHQSTFSDRNKTRVYVSDQTHHSVEKALLIIGYHPQQIIAIPSNKKFQMDIAALKTQIDADIAAGWLPSVIIASAGTTNTGSVDPLEDLAQISQAHDIWLHVDGAFGASFLLVESQKQQFKGIQYADSVSWDGHKMLYQTYDSAMIIVKNKQHLLNSFSAEPEYLKDISLNEKDNFGSMGIELTRPARAVKLWITLHTLGEDEIARRLQHSLDLASTLTKRLKQNQHWQIISGPQFGIVNFRYYDPHMAASKLNQINKEISDYLIAQGDLVIFTTILEEKTVLRMACLNYNLTETELNETYQVLESVCSDIIAKY